MGDNNNTKEKLTLITTLPLFGTLSRHESFRLTSGIGMIAGGVLLGGVSGMMSHASDEYSHRQMYGHIKAVQDKAASQSKLVRLMSMHALKYGGFVSMFVGTELALGRARGIEDDWNVCMAGAITGGAFTARGGAAAAIAGTVMGCSLAYITSAGLDILQNLERIMVAREEEDREREATRVTTKVVDSTEVQINRLQNVLSEWPEQPKK
jgi:hypothetical protein